MLGDGAALDEVRRRVDSDPASGSLLVDALAIAGDDSDAARLLQIAEHGGPAAKRAALAAGNLGVAAVLPRLEGLRTDLGDDLIDRASRAIKGDLAASFSGPERLLRGAPWTPEGAIERLADPDELRLAQDWIALELSVRTGIPMPRPTQPGAPAKDLTAVADAWRSALRDYRPRRGGTWLYFGKPMRRRA